MVTQKWQDRYADKSIDAEKAVKRIKPGNYVFVGSGCAEPQKLVEALEKAGGTLFDTKVIHTLTLGLASYVHPRFHDVFRHNAFFVGRNVRDAVFEGRADYTPIFMSEIPKLFSSGRIPVDVALIAISPPDRHGYCSFGVSVDVVRSAAESARVVIAEVNQQMPRTLGDSFIHIDDIDLLVENDTPLPEWSEHEPEEVAHRIARYVADLIDDGSTIQIGIGAIPSAVPLALMDKRNLGMHTEMFTDSIIPLVREGVLNNANKTLHRGKIVASFCMGSQELYDFIDGNPIFEFHPSDYANDPFIISQNDNMVAINAALQVDLTGQVCVDSVGHQFYSGIGGHVDFIRGTARAKNGKPIIVMPSTNREGTESRIVPSLSEGAGVVTTRGDVHYVVTEYGVAYLHGKSVRERCLALIGIAHPKFRQELLDYAKDAKYVYEDQALPAEAVEYPKRFETWQTFDGLRVFFRPIRHTDEGRLQDFFYSLSPDTIYTRFFSHKRSLPHREAWLLVNMDYRDQMALAGTIKSGDVERIIAVGRYFREGTGSTAEVAVTVHDDYQNRGIGTSIAKQLIEIAKEANYTGFTAQVMARNQAMVRVFEKTGHLT